MLWFHPLDVVMAPVHWFERARGWRRFALVFVYATAAAVVGLFGSRWVNLWAVPDVPEPFDAARFVRERYAGSADLAAAYHKVMTFLRKQTPDSNKSLTNGRYITDWSQMDAPDQAWFNDNHAMLEPWLEATSRPLTSLPLPTLVPVMGYQDSTGEARFPARVALIEGSKREAAGDLDGAWTCYRSALRGSRQLAMAAAQMRRQTAYHLLKMAQPRVQIWIDEPKLTAAQARRALADLTECIGTSPLPSDTVKAEAVQIAEVLDHPETWDTQPRDRNNPAWYEQDERTVRLRWFVRGEPERSRRLLRLLVSQALAQCDRDPGVQPPMLPGMAGLWQVVAQTPPLVRQFTPERLNRELHESAVLEMAWRIGPTLGVFATDVRDILDPLRFTAAERLYLLERGRPAKRARDLLDGYLDKLPQNVDPDELLAPPVP